MGIVFHLSSCLVFLNTRGLSKVEVTLMVEKTVLVVPIHLGFLLKL